MAQMYLPSISDFYFSDALSLSWLSLGKHIHDDHVAWLVVHNKVEHMSSNLVGVEVHGVITLVELIGAALSQFSISL
jgi:hypothetical protein